VAKKLSAVQLKKRVKGWANGRDPSEFGWIIDHNNVTCADISECQTWEELGRIIGEDIAQAIKDDDYEIHMADMWLNDVCSQA